MSSNQKAPGAGSHVGKREWARPEISSFEAVTVTKGIWINIGDGFNNMS